jgi:hypothetical protein
MAVAPTLLAARDRSDVGSEKASDRVADACARTLPTTRGADSRFALLDLCVKNTHAAGEAAALAWAPPGPVAFYRDEREPRWTGSPESKRSMRPSWRTSKRCKPRRQRPCGRRKQPS